MFGAVMCQNQRFLATVEQPTMNITQLKDLALGVIIGAGGSDRVPHGFPCIGDISIIKANITTAINDIKTMNPEKIAEALKTISAVIHLVNNGSCAQM
jgi:hypothetical protein